MSTAAIPRTAAGSTPLVVRPAPLLEPPGGQGGTVVKMPSRIRAGAALPSTVGTRPASKVHALAPEAAERATVAAMSGRIAQSAVEVLNGVRSVHQLSRWLDARCMSSLTTRARLHAEACKAVARRGSHEAQDNNVHLLHPQPVVHSVHCSAISPGIFETAVVIADRTRFRAMAMRFEFSRGLWKVTALRIG
ncbi:Rv3235 family protein [Arthrobacter sp. HLT1-20]